MRTEGIEYAALEVSSHALSMRRVDFVQFAAGVFTNLTSEHLDYHGNMTNYREAKEHLFNVLGPAAYAVLNADDSSSQAMASKTSANILRYGIKRKADIRAKIKSQSLDGTEITLRAPSGKIDLLLPMIG